MMRKVEYRGRASTGGEAGYEALQSMLKGEYTEESTGARTIRQTGGKDRHSKVFTSKGPRDRRVRLSVATAIRFYDLQDRLGFEQPSKAVEWLLLHCQPSIQALPQLGSLQPVRVAAIPRAVYMDHPPPHHHKGKKNHDDQITHYNRENQSSHHIHTLHSLASYNDFHVQDSIEEDPPQSSNPSSSGASSDHPMQQLCETTWPDCKALSETQPVMPDHVQASLGLRQRPASPEFSHMNKRSRILQNPANSSPHQHSQADNYGTFTSSGSADAVDLATMHPLNQRTNSSLAAVGRMLGINYSDIAPLNYSSFTNNRHITSLFINENNALHLNSNLQGQMNVGTQPSIMNWLPSSNHEPNQYTDITQTLLAAQVNHVVNNASINPHNVIQEACNISLFDRRESHPACTPINLSDTVQLNNKAGTLQQVEELLSNMYTSPSRSPSESTSINTIPGPGAASFSKAGSNIANIHQGGHILYRPSWSTPLKQENHHHSLL